MNALPVMAQAAERFRDRLLAEPGCAPLSMPGLATLTGAAAVDVRWNNVLLTANTFRRAHVETFDVPGRLSVLHVCIFPHLDDLQPIFGFDMVAGPSRVTGIFLDLSPAGGPVPGLSLTEVFGPAALADFVMRRELPEWGDIFSKDMLAVRPIDLNEVNRAIGLAHQALEGFLTAPRSTAAFSRVESAAGQSRYINGQRRNEHTFRMLASFIGQRPARRFIDEVLFPLEEMVDS